MKVVFDSYRNGEEIPATAYVKNRKLIKYFNRETAAALVCVGKLLHGESISRVTPLYYAMGTVEYEDYGLRHIFSACSDENGSFSQKHFIKRGMSSVSPLTQFKVLYNMALCFISIEHSLVGDNASLYSTAAGLLTAALYSKSDYPIILGAGKVYADGSIESGFALASKEELRTSPFFESNKEAIELFKEWNTRKETL